MSITRLAGWAALVLGALATGVIATKPLMKFMVERSSIHAGPWGTLAATGSADANFYERSVVAVIGIYALSHQETVYYTAFTDSDGRTLDGRCDYVLAGRPLPARWWSFTMYGDDSYLVPNTARIFSRHASNLEFEPDGSYRIAVSAQSQPRNWLPAPAGGAFSVTARLYNPATSVVERPAEVPMPRIERGACPGERNSGAGR